MIILLIFTTVVAALAVMLMLKPSQAVDGGVLDAQGKDLMTQQPEDHPTAILAGGCFWCLESEFRALDGVLYTKSGYIGGELENPSYEDITTGKTGHAEAVEITYDPDIISYHDLIEFFLTKAHDPTQLNRQGVDIGTQYRSEIFFLNEEQKQIAQDLIKRIDDQGLYKDPVVTKISAAEKFWPAEGYHQQYYEKYEKEEGKIHPRVLWKKQKR